MTYLRPLTTCTLGGQNRRVFDRDTAKFAGKVEASEPQPIDDTLRARTITENFACQIFKVMPGVHYAQGPGSLRFFTREWCILELFAAQVISHRAACVLLAEEDDAVKEYLERRAAPPKPKPTEEMLKNRVVRRLPRMAVRRFLCWSELVDLELAERQARWEVWQQILRARLLGVTFKRIGQSYGVEGARAVQMFHVAKRAMQRPSNSVSPVERYLKV